MSLYKKYTPIDFSETEERVNRFVLEIEKNKEKLIDILLEYESFEVVNDEINRTLDLLTSLAENKEYFSHRVGAVTSFMPRNQPLYALSCFVLVPSLMAQEVYFRIPAAMKFFFSKVIKLLDVHNYFPNIVISEKERFEFLKERTALLINPSNHEENVPVTDVVIFTGTSKHADQLRMLFPKRTLFITNGSGHNPLIVARNANLEKATEATLSLTLYNQGQDCAAPNTIIVHDDVHEDFLSLLIQKIKKVKIGAYVDRDCRVGPISNAMDLVRVKEFLVTNREYMHPATPGIINTFNVTLEPVVIAKPLKEGGNYDEIFAPVIFVQKFSGDEELKKYFEDKKYSANAMYVTLYGDNKYILDLKDMIFDGRKIHDKYSVLQNIHLHEPGIERGTQPYGGRGIGASSIGINGKLIGKATLPQRDIFEWLVLPLIKNQEEFETQKALTECATEVLEKDIQKLLKIKNNELKGEENPAPTNTQDSEIFYFDRNLLEENTGRYIQVGTTLLYSLLKKHNTKCIELLSLQEINLIKSLVLLMESKQKMSEPEFKKKLYAIPKKSEISDNENKSRQKHFFTLIYKLLFGKTSGPRLNHFLYEVDNTEVLKLLDI